MKKAMCLFLAFALLFSLSGCAGTENEPEQDTSPISMLIALGNGEAYYKALADTIRQQLGIEVEFVYQISANTTDMQRLYFANNDLPADIIFTASKTNDELLKDCCVDLLSLSSVTALFTPTTIQGCTTDEGAIYQLPVSTKLIGITYNETLLEEMGWDVPESFDDMVELKAKCDEAGIRFAICDGAATGHGFNWLFHLMGSQWLSTPEGTEWFEGFQAGTRSIEEFKEKCEYFKKWTEAGLWGSVHNQDWSGNYEFSTVRALFWYGLTNSVAGYSGPMLDKEGNETGVTLNDTFKTIPWLSEYGSNNCYTYYDNCWIYLSKALEAPEKSEKLQKALKILEFLASDDATALVSNMSKDSYVPVNNYQAGSDRVYSAYIESIRNGFVQPWYYNSFDADSISFTGAAVNAYILGTGSFDDIFKTLDEYNQLHLNKQIHVLANFPDGLDYENTARLVAVSAATAVNSALEASGSAERIEVALAPYTPGANLMQPWRSAAVSNSFVYPGDLDIAVSNCLIPPGIGIPCAVRMSGAEIKELIGKGFDPSDRFVNAETGESSFDAEHYGPYPYVCVVKDGAELEDGREYPVALCEAFLTRAQASYLSENGRFITGLEGVCSLEAGLKQFGAQHPVITPEDLVL